VDPDHENSQRLHAGGYGGSDAQLGHAIFLGRAGLRAEPIVLTVPEIENNRYYSVQFTDAYTFNFAYIGTATTGNEAGSFLVAGPNWQPAQKGLFSMYLRMHWPKEAALDGSWKAPKVERVK
jgi:hypothetical protein